MAPNELNMIILISAYTPTHIPVAPHIYTVHMSPSTNKSFQSQRGSITWLRYKESSLWGVGREGALYPASIYDNHCTHLEVVDDSCHTQPHAPWPLAPRKWLQEKAHKSKPSAQEMHTRSVYVHLMHELLIIDGPGYTTPRGWQSQFSSLLYVAASVSITCTTGWFHDFICGFPYAETQGL